MNFVYVVGTGSRWGNNELRYSLRSLANVAGKHSVIVIGHAPPWLSNNAIHIALPDSGKDPIVNVTSKIRAAVVDLPDEFVLMNDDFFVMRTVEAIPIVHCGPMALRIRSLTGRRNPYADAFRRGYAVLRNFGVREPLNFGVHTPFPMERDKLLNLIPEWTTGKTLLKTMYGNVHYPDAKFVRDVKANTWNKTSTFWSTPTHLLPGAQWTLQRRFLKRSEYEKP